MATERGLGMEGFFGGERVRLMRSFPYEENVYHFPELPAGTVGVFVREERRPLIGRVNLVAVRTGMFDGYLLIPTPLLSSTERD